MKTNIVSIRDMIKTILITVFFFVVLHGFDFGCHADAVLPPSRALQG